MSLKGDINKVSSWAVDVWEEMTMNGYFDGTRLGAAITRVINQLRGNILKLILEDTDRITDL
ncbi:hypothetical protein FQU75_22905 [Paenibacillus polymyxa]|nr:hypothetical protein FQU75_22905 [Paenibacillus polymyxa]